MRRWINIDSAQKKSSVRTKIKKNEKKRGKKREKRSIRKREIVRKKKGNRKTRDWIGIKE